MKLTLLASITCLFLGSASAQPREDETLLLHQPALSANHMAFVYAGDLWIANRDGSSPRRLTSHPAEEDTPIFSPDGKSIAYAAEYDGNTDVYIIRVEGGQPKRLTWHPAGDIPVDWATDGTAVAFASNRETDHGRSAQLYHVGLDGGLPVKQMQARFFRGRYDAEGKRLAYISHGAGYGGLFGGAAGWRGYRGGTTPSIRILDLQKKSATTIPGERVTNFNPFWLDGMLYFLSDREDDTFNLYSYEPGSAKIERLTQEKEWDIRSAAGHGKTVVFEVGGALKCLDLQRGASKPLHVHITPDLPELQPAWKTVSGNIDAVDISPSGVRAIVTARGDVFSLPAKHGSPRNLSNTEGVREYSVLWSPKGDQVAWIVDSLEGQTLILADQHGVLSETRYPLGPHFYELHAWHAEKNRIAFSDNHLRLFYISLDNGKITQIALNARRERSDVAFSPDGNWLAYTREQPNFNRDLMIYEFVSGNSHRVSDSMADTSTPAFSPDGKVLYFAASTNSGPLQVGLNMSSQERPYRAGIYAAVLTADGKSPLAPKPGDEEPDKKKEQPADENEKPNDNDAEDDSKEQPADATNGQEMENGKSEEDSNEVIDAQKKNTKPEPVKVDLTGIERRIIGLRLPEGNYSQLQVAHDGNLYFLERPQPGASTPTPGTPDNKGTKLQRFDFEDREMSTVLSDLSAFHISANGKKAILWLGPGSIAITDLGKQLKPEPLDLSSLRLRIDPRREWALIFDEAWRMEKEYFYADNMQGLDWDAVYKKYRPLLDHVVRRADLNTLIIQMVAEMRVGHNNVGGGDLYRGEGPQVGLLGANFTADSGRYRISRIYTGERWNPFLVGPLAVPGNEAREGEYLLAINGQPLTSADDLSQRLENTVGQQVALRVGPNADGSDARDIVVQPIANERELRLWHWVEANRRRVDAATNGRVGYIYLPNTADDGYTFFNRMFFNQIDKQALIIDERSNGGGQAANYIVEVLSRKHLSGWRDRDGLTYNTPDGAIHGPKLMIIDQDAGSGGDYLPYAFRELKIGPLLGTRTWGGLIGIFANPPLVDGGVVTVPFFRFYDTQGRWSVENEGVAPDIEVDLDPIATNEGRDSQLEAAIENILRMLKDYHDEVPRQSPELPTELGK